jgi:hypothetical protein
MINNVILSVAEAYKAMINPPKFQRPSWVPASITEEHTKAFTEAVRTAHSKNATLVEFNGKKYKITSKKLTEALDPKADAGVWISDFMKSDAPQFAGKSEEERKKMALAAWYSARREAGINEEEDAAQLKHDNVDDKQADAEEMPPAPVQEENDEKKEDDDSEEEPVAKTDDAKANPTDVEDAEIEDVKESATEKASEGPKKDEQEKLEPRAPGEKKFYDAHKDKVEIKDGNPLDSQDGTDKVVPADAPSAQNTSPAAPKVNVALDSAKDAKSGEDAVKAKAPVPQTK